MKRTRLKRGGQLRRTGPPKRKTPLRAQSERAAERTRRRRQLRAILAKSSGGRCEMPGGHAEGCNGYGTDAAHILPASLIGDVSSPLHYDPSNHLWLSRQCHEWCEGHPAEALERGANRGINR